jgi:transcriptional regulator with XRE-family HTH domain
VTEAGATDDESMTAATRLAREIRRLRKATGLSHAQLASKIGYTRQYVSMAERLGKGLPAEPLVQAIDEALDANGSLTKLRHQARAESEALRRLPGSPTGSVRQSQEKWLNVRQAPGVRGRELTELAAWLYPELQRALGGHVLAGPGWLLDEPMDLDRVRLMWSETQDPVPPLGPLDHVLPLSDRGEMYHGYSRAVRDLVRPRLLENRLSYRLLKVSQENQLTLTFGTTSFFDVFDAKQAIAHEFKASWLRSGRSIPDWTDLPLRNSIADPFDPSRLIMSPGISTLTIRRSPSGDHRFVLHERDGGKVADGGGLCHVMPAGEFQPSSMTPADVHIDFSLWRNIMREFSEEFLGNPEHDGGGSRSIDYANDEPFRSFEQARAAGAFRLWHYGLVLEPLELGAIQLTVAVIDDSAFDRLFADMVATNDEGHIVAGNNIPFTSEAIERLNPRLSASALTLLRLAWRDRSLLFN